MSQVAQDMEQDDEFAEAEAAAKAVSGYEATAEKDVEDQREFRRIPRGTPCTLAIGGFSLADKGKAAILAKFIVVEPKEYADGGSNFTIRMSLNAVPGKKEDGTEKRSTGFDMTSDQLSWLYAAVHQTPASEGKQAMIRDVLTEFSPLEADDVPAFHAALVENANTQLPKGSTFKVKGIGIDKGQPTGKTDDEGRPTFYDDRQSLGVLDYPKATK